MEKNGQNQLEAKRNTLLLILVFSYILPEYETHNTKDLSHMVLLGGKVSFSWLLYVPKVIHAPKCTKN